MWEIFFDHCYFHMWAVRPIEDRDFNSPRLFHFDKKEDAEAFKILVEKSSYAVYTRKFRDVKEGY